MSKNALGIENTFSIITSFTGTKPLNEMDGFISLNVGEPEGQHSVVIGQNGATAGVTDIRSVHYPNAQIVVVRGYEAHEYMETLWGSPNHGNGNMLNYVNNASNYGKGKKFMQEFELELMKMPGVINGEININGNAESSMYRYSVDLILINHFLLP